ncbi:MAG: porin [Opitutaceae bacterium]|jgi:phosphate-selective porin
MAVLTVTSLVAEPSTSLEERLSVLETRMGQLQTENAALKNELGRLSQPGLLAVMPAGKEPKLKINGLVQFQGEFGDTGDSRYTTDNNDRFLLRRVRLGVSGEFLEEVDFKVEGEYVGTSVTLTDGFVNWSHFDEANLKFGQFKTPFGYEFLAADPKLYTIERSLGSDVLTLNRQIGAQASGQFLDKRLTYAAGLFNGNGANIKTNDNDSFLYAGRVAGTPWQGKLFNQPATWTVGANAYASTDKSVSMNKELLIDSTPATPAADNIFCGNRVGWGVDTQLKLGGLDLWTEYIRVTFNPDSAKPAAEFDADTWYVQAGYFVIPNKLQPVLKFETFDPNTSVSGDETDTWTLGLNYFLKGDDLKAMIGYTISDTPSADGDRKLFLRLQTIF